MDYRDIKTHFKIKQERGDISKAICPCHPDKQASLSIKYDNKQGKTVIYCHAGCETRDILSSVGLKISDLFDNQFDKDNSKSNIEAVYKYTDDKGVLLFEKVRFKPKRFSQRRIIDGITVWGLEKGTYYETFSGSNAYAMKERETRKKEFEGIEPVIYNLPGVIKAVANNKTVFIVEGEKDVGNLEKWGFTATCNFDGASKSNQKPKWKKSYNRFFSGANVVLIPDKDAPGIAHMNNIAENIISVAKSIKIVNLSDVPEKGDISDYIAAGHTKEELEDLIEKTENFTISKQDLDTVEIVFNPKFVIEGKTKITIMPVMENIISVLKHYNYEVKYNAINRKILVYEKGKIINELGEDTIYRIRDKCIIHNLNISPVQLKGQLYRIGLKNSFNPVKDYLLSCKDKWDNKSHLQELYNTLECDEISEKYKEKYIRKTLITAVNLILNPKVSNSEGVLTLAGDQGIGKTSWFEHLIPEKFTVNEQELYFLEGQSLELRKKDSLMESTASWFTELGEISSTFKKSEIDDLKNFITRPSDRFRIPYGIGSKDYRRFTIFVATVNDEEFLHDSTGNRRWWVLKCKSINYNHKINMDLIWGEAVHLWETGKETNYFTREEQQEMQQYNERFESLDNTTLLIMSYFNFQNEIRYWMKASEIFEIMEKPNNFNTKKLGIALKRLKLDVKVKDGYKYYAMPPVKDSAINMNQFERANYLDVKEIEEITMLDNKLSG